MILLSTVCVTGEIYFYRFHFFDSHFLGKCRLPQLALDWFHFVTLQPDRNRALDQFH